MNRTWAVALCCTALMAGGCVTVGVGKEPGGQCATGFINKTLQSGGEERGYVVFVPRGYDPAKKWPLVVFLHGAGERGNDGYQQTEVGIGRAIRMHPYLYPCLVAMPQCPPEGWWAPPDPQWGKDFVVSSAQIDEILARTLDEYNVDRKRIYLTGLSMGGFGTWTYGAAHADTFAALMPVCGGGNPADAPALAKVPIWAFHGGADSVVPPDQSREMVEAVKNAGGNIEYTEYPGVDHNSWDKTYADPRAIEWLLSQHK